MSRDDVNREVLRLLASYCALPAHELFKLADNPTEQSPIADVGGTVTYTVNLRRTHKSAVRVTVSAISRNWWKFERIDESATVDCNPAQIECNSLNTLFHHLRNHVSEEDIRQFSPGDPGYPDYVREWVKILTTGVVPTRASFDHSEVIGLTCWSDSGDFQSPMRFHRYRLFTLAVACKLFVLGNCTEDIRAGNYVAIKMINDARDLGDDGTSMLVGNALPAIAEALSSQPWIEEEYPFFYAAEMIWAQRHRDFDRAVSVASKLIESEQSVRQHEEFFGESQRFLFGLTIYDQLNDEWDAALCELANPTTSEEMQLVIDTLAHERLR